MKSAIKFKDDDAHVKFLIVLIYADSATTEEAVGYDIKSGLKELQNKRLKFSSKVMKRLEAVMKFIQTVRTAGGFGSETYKGTIKSDRKVLITVGPKGIKFRDPKAKEKVLGICHCDLKPENILFNAHMCIKLADFWFTKFLAYDQTKTSCGVILYALVVLLPVDHLAADPLPEGALWALQHPEHHRTATGPDQGDDLHEIRDTLHAQEHQGAPRLQHWDPRSDELCSPCAPPGPTMSCKLVSQLMQMGYPDHEGLIAELVSPRYTRAKIFYFLLENRLDIAMMD